MASVFTNRSVHSPIMRYLSATFRVSVCAVLIAILFSLLQEPGVVRSAGPITEYPIPITTIGRLTEVTTGEDGNLWFLESTSPEVEFAFGRIQQMTVREPISVTSLDSFDSRLSGITLGQFGEILFAEPDRNAIGRIFPAFSTGSPQLEEFIISSAGGRPLGVAGLDNAIWFTLSGTGQIGRLSLDAERITTYYNLETQFSSPSAITIGPDNRSLYFINTIQNVVTGPELVTARIGRITLDGSIREFPIPNADSRPNAMTTGPDGNIWLTDPGLNAIWRLTPAGDLASFSIPTEESGPSGIITGPDGKLYFTESNASRIGVITIDGVMGEIPTPTEGSGPTGITVGSDGNIWFTEPNAAQMGRLALAADLGMSATFSRPSAGKGQDVTLTINITNQGPDSAANATISLGGLLPHYTIISCNPGMVGGVCLPVNDEVPDYLIRIPFIPNGGIITATVVVRITNCAVSTLGTALPEISSELSLASQVPDQAPDNNSLFVTISTSPAARVTVADGSAEITLGPVIPRVSFDPNAPTAVLRLDNTGCVPLQLTVDSLRRIPSSGGSGSNGACARSAPAIGDDFKFFEIGELASATALATALRGTRQAFQLGQPLRNGMPLPIIPPGESLRLGVRFKAQLPSFVGDSSLSTDYLLPDEVQTMFALSQSQVISGGSAPPTQVPMEALTVRIRGLISPVVQIVPRDPDYGQLVQLTASGDKFEVRFSAFDARLNVRRAVFQFLDQYRGSVASPISVPLENSICQKGVVSGQSFTIVTSFTGAAKYPEIKGIRVTIFDDEGSSTADSFPNFSTASRGSMDARISLPQSATNNLTIVSPPMASLPSRGVKPRDIRSGRK